MGERASKYIDMTGMLFGRWTVIELSHIDDGGQAMWLCECVCGTRKIVSGKNLRQGKTTSCGCYRKDCIHQRLFKDLTGMKFNHLHVTKLHNYNNKIKKYIWECRCDCENICYASTEDLLSGHTKSCGCIKSHSEVFIADFLNQHNIIFQRQKRFPDCRDKNPLIFDFYIPSMNLCIEYDGELHYMETTFFNDLEGQQRRDAIKDKYCKDNNIKLLRIPYWEKDNIESILSDWLFLNCAEDANSSDADLSA